MKSIQERLTQADALANEGDLEAAWQIYTDLEKIKPDSRVVLMKMAKLAQTRQDFANSIRILDRLLTTLPDDGARRVWLMQKAEALVGLKRQDEALEVYETARKAFPDFANLWIKQARLLIRLKEFAQATVILREARKTFTGESEVRWLSLLVTALQGDGRDLIASILIETMVEMFPNEADTVALYADDLQRSGHYEEALKVWDKCLQEHAEHEKPTWLFGRAKCLTALWRLDEAKQILIALYESDPELLKVKRTLMHFFEDQEDWSSALKYCDAGDLDQNQLMTKGRYLVRLRRYQEAEQISDELKSRFLDVADWLLLRNNIDASRNKTLESEKWIEQGLRDYPDDQRLKSIYNTMLLQYNRTDEVEEISADQEEINYTHRWLHLAATEGGGAALAVMTEDWSGSGTYRISGRKRSHLLRFITNWFLTGTKSYMGDKRETDAIPFAMRLLATGLNTNPHSIENFTHFVQCLIALGHHDYACRLIERLPYEMHGHHEVGKVMAWERVAKGDLPRAREIWTQILERKTYASIHGEVNSLYVDQQSLLKEPNPGVSAFVPVRNEMHNLPHFLAHHRRIGVSSFVMIDNGSVDGTLEYLREQPDVLLYRSEDNFLTASNGMLWINVLIHRHAPDGWRLFLDADEEFIYPGYETKPIEAFCKQLDAEGAEGVFAFMFDVYPERFNPDWDYDQVRTSCRFFDNAYHRSHLLTPPYKDIRGGIRERLFGDLEWLPKTPLTKGVSDYLTNHHTLPIAMASASGLLLHYKLADLWRKGRIEPEDDDQYADRGRAGIGRYRRYFSYFDELSEESMLKEGVSCEIQNSAQLTALGLMSDFGTTIPFGAKPLADTPAPDEIRVFPIERRLRLRDTNLSGPFSFVYAEEAKGGMDWDHQGHICYSADTARSSLLYTLHDEPEQIFKHSFMYMAQFDTAHSVMEVPVTELSKMDAANPAQPLFVFSLGRCGSTALSQALSDAGFPSASEPDLLTQMALQRGQLVHAFGEDGLQQMLHALTRNLAFHLGKRYAIKLRSQCNLIVDDILGVFPDTRPIFIFRDWRTWAVSMHRAFGTGGANLARNMRRGILAYHRLMERGSRPILLWYEDLRSGVGDSLVELGISGLQDLATGDNDAQAGTSLSQDTLTNNADYAEIFRDFEETWSWIRPECLSEHKELTARLGLI